MQNGWPDRSASTYSGSSGSSVRSSRSSAPAPRPALAAGPARPARDREVEVQLHRYVVRGPGRARQPVDLLEGELAYPSASTSTSQSAASADPSAGGSSPGGTAARAAAGRTRPAPVAWWCREPCAAGGDTRPRPLLGVTQWDAPTLGAGAAGNRPGAGGSYASAASQRSTRTAARARASKTDTSAPRSHSRRPRGAVARISAGAIHQRGRRPGRGAPPRDPGSAHPPAPAGARGRSFSARRGSAAPRAPGLRVPAPSVHQDRHCTGDMVSVVTVIRSPSMQRTQDNHARGLGAAELRRTAPCAVRRASLPQPGSGNDFRQRICNPNPFREQGSKGLGCRQR